MVHPQYRVVRGRHAAPARADAGVSDHRGPWPGRLRRLVARRARRKRPRATRCRSRCSRSSRLPPFGECGRRCCTIRRPAADAQALQDAHATRRGAASSSTSCSRSSCRCACTTSRRKPVERARRCGRAGRLRARCCERLPFRLTRAQHRRSPRSARPRAAASDAAPAAGRRRQRQDDRRRAGRAAGDRDRLPGRGHGADRNPRRAALPQILATGSRRSACRSPGSRAA